MNEDRLDELLTRSVLGQLSPTEEQELDALLAADPRSQQSHDDLTRVLADLPDLAPVPPGAEDRLLARLQREVLPVPAESAQPTQSAQPAQLAIPVAGRPNRLLPWLGLGGVAAGVALAVLLNLSGPSPERQLATFQAIPGAQRSVALAQNGRQLAAVVAAPDGRTLVVMSDPLPTGRTYQAWKIVDGKPVSLGLFRGRAFVASGRATFAVTVEPEGGSAQPTTAPLFARPI